MNESETIELKRSTSELKEALISIVAILNKHQKGKLYFGIKNNGEAVGQDVSDKTLRQISQAISEHIEPKIYPKIFEVKLKGKSCVCVEFLGNDGPYFAYGRSYMRVADEDRRLSVKDIEGMIIRKSMDKLRWDGGICEDAKISDISQKKLAWFLKKAGLKHESVESSVDKLGLMKDGRLLNTAVILFGKRPQQFFPNARLRCAVFGGTDTAYIIDMHDYEGDLFYLIEKAEEYLLQNIHIGMRLDGFYRIDVPEIDKDAFREAVINAFCHRDYHQYDSVGIAIFKDRVEVRSPGLLYGGLTIQRIRKEGVSARRNELLAEMFHKVHFVENWGSGIGKILSKEPNTTFKEIARLFITVFERKEFKDVTKRVTEKVTDNQQRILRIIEKDSGITAPELSKAVGISTRKIKENLAKLKEKNLLRRVGSARGGYWEILVAGKKG